MPNERKTDLESMHRLNLLLNILIIMSLSSFHNGSGAKRDKVQILVLSFKCCEALNKLSYLLILNEDNSIYLRVVLKVK